MTEAPPLAGVIGWPIGHSRSPRLHAHWLRRHGLAGTFVALPVKPEDLEDVLRALPRMGFRGANVTLPHKQAVLSLAEQVTDRARRIGASNLITFLPSGGFIADNADGTGFINNLRSSAPDWQATAGPAVVLGAGGGARAIVDALLDAGVPEVRIANRTARRAEDLAVHFGGAARALRWEEVEAFLADAATLVNTTSLGMVGQPPLELSLARAPKRALVADIVYQPLETPLLRQARELGLQAVDGLGMLLHQAVPAFEAFFGQTPTVDDDLRVAVLAEPKPS